MDFVKPITSLPSMRRHGGFINDFRPSIIAHLALVFKSFYTDSLSFRPQREAPDGPWSEGADAACKRQLLGPAGTHRQVPDHFPVVEVNT